MQIYRKVECSSFKIMHKLYFYDRRLPSYLYAVSIWPVTVKVFKTLNDRQSDIFNKFD